MTRETCWGFWTACRCQRCLEEQALIEAALNEADPIHIEDYYNGDRYPSVTEEP